MLLVVVCGFFVVSFALGFGAGWYVRGAYTYRDVRRVLDGWGRDHG